MARLPLAGRRAAARRLARPTGTPRLSRRYDADPFRLDEGLAFYVATRGTGPHALPPALKPSFTRLEQHLRAATALRRRCARLARRMATLEADVPPDTLWRRLRPSQPGEPPHAP